MPATLARPKASARAKSLAYRLRAALEKYRAAKLIKTELSDELAALGVTQHEFKDGIVLVRICNKMRAASLSNLAEILGEKKAKEVWEQLPERSSEYFTLQTT